MKPLPRNLFVLHAEYQRYIAGQNPEPSFVGLLLGMAKLIFGNWCLWLAGFFRAGRLYNLLQDGRVLRGQVWRCASLAESDGVLLRLDYRFVSPTGEPLHSTIHAFRDDLHGRSLPQPGTAVAVLYMDELNHTVL